jgi:hypothetical protein
MQNPSPHDDYEALFEQQRQAIAKIDKVLEDPSLPPEKREKLLEERQDLARDYVMAKILGEW